MAKFVGREEELKKLRGLFQKDSASLAVIRGRRRIGKSRLIEEFAKNKKAFTFAGLPPNKKTTIGSQRDEFARQMTKNFGMPFVKSDDWNELFWHLDRFTNEGSIILVLDEISWMGSKDPDFLGKLKNFWDMQLSKNPKLILILCGSVSIWIEENILSHTGFLGRVSLSLLLQELPLNDCKKFWGDQQERVSSYELFRILSITGGIPKYLEEVIPKLSAEENIRKLCFQPEGLLYREFDQIFSDLFLKRSKYFKHIVEQLGSSPLSIDQLCERLSVKKGGAISKRLNELILAGFVSADATWNIKTNNTSNLKQYRIKDNYLRFYLKYILPNKEQIEKGLFQVKSMSSLQGWNSIMGLQFENLVLNNFFKLFELLDIDPNDVIQFGPFFQRQTERKKGCQIDILIQTRHKVLYICEIKFSSSELGSNVISEMKEKIANLYYPKGMSIRTVLIHVNGVNEGIEDSGLFDYVVDFSDLIGKVSQK